jgi:hypothetical protein
MDIILKSESRLKNSNRIILAGQGTIETAIYPHIDRYLLHYRPY